MITPTIVKADLSHAGGHTGRWLVCSSVSIETVTRAALSSGGRIHDVLMGTTTLDERNDRSEPRFHTRLLGGIDPVWANRRLLPGRAHMCTYASHMPDASPGVLSVPEPIDSLLSHLHILRRNRPVVVVAVDGAGGAGKSFFAEKLAERDTTIGVVHTDEFYLPSAERPHANGDGTFGSDFDLRRLRDQVLQPLRSGIPARYQRYDWPTDTLAEWREVEHRGIVLVEGVYTMRADLAPMYDLTIWLESPRSVRLDRALARDGAAMRRRWVDEWMPEEDRYIRAQQPTRRADLVVDGTAPLALYAEGVFLVIENRPGLRRLD